MLIYIYIQYPSGDYFLISPLQDFGNLTAINNRAFIENIAQY